MYYPPLGANQDWSNAPPPGQRSDHGSPGHGLFLGNVADAIDMGSTYQPVYAISDLSIYEKWFHYSSADGQPFGWVAKCRLSDGRRIVYAHLQNSPTKNEYARGEQIDIISDILNYDHLHFEMEGVLAGDMPALFIGGDEMDPRVDILAKQLEVPGGAEYLGKEGTTGDVIAKLVEDVKWLRTTLTTLVKQLEVPGGEEFLGRGGNTGEVVAKLIQVVKTIPGLPSETEAKLVKLAELLK